MSIFTNLPKNGPATKLTIGTMLPVSIQRKSMVSKNIPLEVGKSLRNRLALKVVLKLEPALFAVSHRRKQFRHQDIRKQ